MTFYDPSIQERGLSLIELPDDKGEYSARDHNYKELSSVAALSGPIGKISKVSFLQKTSRNSSSPLGSSPPSPSELDQSLLHRRNNRLRKAGTLNGKENNSPLRRQPGKTLAAKAGRLVLADVTHLPQGRSESFNDIPFAGSTSIQSPSRKVDNGEPGAAGLKFELDQEPSLANTDSQETVTAHDSFVAIDIESVDRPSGSRPESRPSTPIREVLASFNNMFSSTFISPSKKSRTASDPPNTFRMSFRLPSSPLPTGVALSDAFSLSTLADSLSQLTGDIAASFASRYENDPLCQGQYHEDAVARDEMFHWEEEMKCLENQYGI